MISRAFQKPETFKCGRLGLWALPTLVPLGVMMTASVVFLSLSSPADDDKRIHRFFDSIHRQSQTEPVTVVLLGDSILARTAYNTPVAEPQSTPPLVESRNISHMLWQSLGGPARGTHRRLDHPDWDIQGTYRVVSSTKEWSASDAYPGVTLLTDDPSFQAEIELPEGYEKAELIFRSLPDGGRVGVTVSSATCSRKYTIDTRHCPAEESSVNSVFGRRYAFELDRGLPQTICIKKEATSPIQDMSRIGLWGITFWKDGYLRWINAAKGSHTSEMLVPWLLEEVLPHVPDYVIYEFPLLNDSYVDEDKVALSEKYNRKILETLLEQEIPLVAIIPNPSEETLGDSKYRLAELVTLCQRLAEEYRIPCANVYRAFLEIMTRDNLKITDLTADGTHPNDRGVAVYASAFDIAP